MHFDAVTAGGGRYSGTALGNREAGNKSEERKIAVRRTRETLA